MPVSWVIHMIKFFRKIRQRLLTENKFSKYLIYAIGEIVLVVIGILIALSINNWNEHKKTESKIRTSLLALKSDLIQDSLLIHEQLPEVKYQFQLNESFRTRVAKPNATVDTLLKIMRREFNPNWNNPILYNTNAYNSLNQTGLVEGLSDSLKAHIKNFYNKKLNLNGFVISITNDYKTKVSNYVDTYTFGSTALHDQGQLIDSLVWNNIDTRDLAAKFQGISNFKRILFSLTMEDMEYSLNNSKTLLQHIDYYLNKL
jgi:hypothetical protein